MADQITSGSVGPVRYRDMGDGTFAPVAAATMTTLLAGEDLANNVQGTNQRPVAAATYSPSTYKDAGTVTSANIKTGAGSVYAVYFTNTNPAVRFLQLHNVAGPPTAGGTASLFFLVPAGSDTAPAVLRLDSAFFAPSEYFSAGIAWAVSTVAARFVNSALATDHTVMIRYV